MVLKMQSIFKMKVYVVLSQRVFACSVLAVFSCRQSAEQYVNNRNENDKCFIVESELDPSSSNIHNFANIFANLRIE